MTQRYQYLPLGQDFNNFSRELPTSTNFFRTISLVMTFHVHMISSLVLFSPRRMSAGAEKWILAQDVANAIKTKRET